LQRKNNPVVDIVREAQKALDSLNDSEKTPVRGCVKTGDIRRMSAGLFRDLENKAADSVFALCGELLEQRSHAMGVIAYDFAHRVRSQYREDMFGLFEGWLEKYVRGWGDCDDFCTHAFGDLICRFTGLSENVTAWIKREEFWMRRAAAVVLIPSIGQNKYGETNPLLISDLLMADEHDLVRKGYGWMLKIMSKKEPDLVFEYMLKNKEHMPRVAYRYAVEKFAPEKRRILMR
jgi:3-methyladenine DNA glycosylase AlkD